MSGGEILVMDVVCPSHGTLSAEEVTGGWQKTYPILFSERLATMALIHPGCGERVTLGDPQLVPYRWDRAMGLDEEDTDDDA